MVSSGMLRHVALVKTDVSEERSASFVSVTRIGELGTTLAETSNRRTLRRNTSFGIAALQVNYRPILLSERAPHTKTKHKCLKINTGKEKEELVAGPRYRGRLADWPSVVTYL
jgi:hypothetical protein